MFDFLKKRIEISDDDIVALTDSDMYNIEDVDEEVFSEKQLGDGVAFSMPKKELTLCSPANGTLTMLFSTGHAFGVTMNDGTEILIHIGIDTVLANGKGFRLLGKKQGDSVKAGDPIVEVNYELLSKKYDMSTMLIITSSNRKISFSKYGKYNKYQSIIEK